MSNFQTVYLHEIAKIGMGQSPASSSYNHEEQGYPFLQGSAEFGKKHPTADIYTDKPTRIAPKGSILISVRAPVGDTNWADRDYCIGRGLAYIAKGDASIDYLFYALQQQRYALERVSQGSTFSAISSQDLRQLQFELPPLPEQRKIARILSTADEAIEHTEELIAKYQAIKQGLMHDLLTRGVDESGRLRPPRERAPELYKWTELGWVPRAWYVTTLRELVPQVEYGISKPLSSHGLLPVIRMNNLHKSTFVLNDLKYTSDRVPTKLLLKPNDVLFNRTNSLEHVGRASLWKEGYPTATFASYLVRLTPDLEKLLPQFLNLWLNWSNTQISIRQFATPGVHQVNINPTNLRRVQIAVPGSLFEQRRIVRKIASIDDLIFYEHSHLIKLEKLKTGLMHDLLTGRVRVNVDEHDLAEVRK